MSPAHLEILVEEPSMEVAVRTIVPRLVNEALTFEVYPSNGKADLLRKLGARLRGYSAWLPARHRVMVLVDRDNEDCRELKRLLEQEAMKADMLTRTVDRSDYSLVNRIVCEELEAWYFGDWEAVRAEFPSVPATIPSKAAYRNPDAIKGGTCEEFERILQRAGYFKGGLLKIEAARRIAPHLSFDRSRSASFRAFCSAVIEIADLSR